MRLFRRKHASLRRDRKALRYLEILLWCGALVGLGSYAAVYLERTVFQAREKRVFETEMKRHALQKPLPETVAPLTLSPGDLIGRIEIPRLGLESIIVESTTNEALRRSVGHIQGTALPGQPGNVGLAAHRDTHFRSLAQVRRDDLVRLTTLRGSFEYSVVSIRIVRPEDISVLDPGREPLVTLVTCYPFNYVGAAPKRFVVQAREVAPLAARPQSTPGS